MNDTQKQLFEAYKEFVFTHTIPNGEIVSKDDFHLRLNSPYAEGSVNFYDLTDVNALVVELCVTQVKDDKACFYLHFELRDLDYAKELFAEMLGSYIAVKDAGKTRILLCCTSAFTTTYFANKLNETASYLDLPFEFNAVSYDRVFRSAFDYDMVLLAPQEAFNEPALKHIFDDIPIITAPPAIFAAYDAAGMIETVRKELATFRTEAMERSLSLEKEAASSDKNILSIAVIRNWGHAQLAYCVYEKGVPGEEHTVLKGRLDLVRDICDIMDTAAYLQAKYDIVSISLPGIFDGGHILQDPLISPDVDLVKTLEDRYHIPVVLVNDTNAAAVGLAARKKDCSSIAFFFLADGGIANGVGFALDGKQYAGSHRIAGEMQFITNSLFPRDNMFTANMDPHKMAIHTASLCTKIVASTFDPELICVCSRMIPEIDELAEEVKKDIPEQFLPEITTCREKEMKEYMLLGGMICADTAH